MKKMLRKILIALSATIALSASADDDNRSEFYKKMKAAVEEKKVVEINSPEEYIYNLTTTDFMKGLLNQFAGLTRIAATTENQSALDEISKDMFLNVICAQSALGEGGKEHYEIIEKLSLQGLNQDLFKKNIEYLMSRAENLRGIVEVPLTIKECKKEGDIAIDFGNASKLMKNK